MDRIRHIACLLILFLVSCKEAQQYEKSVRIEPRWAGQYVLNDAEQNSRLKSLRYILSPDGSAERHLLSKSSRWADFRLEEILRGRWSSGEQSIEIHLSDGNETISISFDSISTRMNPRDSSQLDTFWMDTERPQISLKRIASF